ncbi:MAG: CSLREA domain-containing protein [Acidobacteria bacterium]|nr:MAG: CSLREA domain-containing protein [Acidobacteriota bacterium]REK03569.1 MAG: CSLREA domain-containing protein [Acidobacteriota bacterium]
MGIGWNRLRLARLGALGALVLTGSSSALAADLTIVVTSIADEASDVNDLCTLREALSTVNSLVQVDSCGPGAAGSPLPVGPLDGLTIQIPAGTYVLGVPGTSEDLNASGDLDVRRTVTISGAGIDQTVIDGAQNDRVLEVHSVTSLLGRPVVLRGLTLRSGRPPIEQNGGCLRSKSSLLLLERTRIAECDTPEPVFGGFGGLGGGISIEGGAVTIRRSEIVDNTAFQGSGGGILVAESAAVDIVDSTIARNRALIQNGFVSGGGLSNFDGTVNILGSAVIDNEVTGSGGGLANGGILARTMNVMNSTIARNSATGGGGGINNTRDLSLTNVTITENVADSNGDDDGDGGGLRVSASGFASAVLKANVIAWNQDDSPVGSTSIRPDVSGTVNSAGFNIVLDGEGLSGIVDGVLSDRVGVDPLLDLPTGSPEHYPLLPGSVAIDQIPRPVCVAVSTGANTLWRPVPASRPISAESAAAPSARSAPSRIARPKSSSTAGSRATTRPGHRPSPDSPAWLLQSRPCSVQADKRPWPPGASDRVERLRACCAPVAAWAGCVARDGWRPPAASVGS